MNPKADWKTTLFGAIAGIGALVAQSPAGSIPGLPASAQGWAGVASAISVLLLGVFAKDAQSKAAQPPANPPAK